MVKCINLFCECRKKLKEKCLTWKKMQDRITIPGTINTPAMGAIIPKYTITESSVVAMSTTISNIDSTASFVPPPISSISSIESHVTDHSTWLDSGIIRTLHSAVDTQALLISLNFELVCCRYATPNRSFGASISVVLYGW